MSQRVSILIHKMHGEGLLCTGEATVGQPANVPPRGLGMMLDWTLEAKQYGTQLDSSV